MRPGKKLIYTVVLLAAAAAFRLLPLIPFIGSVPYSTPAAVTLVNMCLYLSVLLTDEAAAGLLISVFAPAVAYLSGQLAYFSLTPFVALGCAALVICFYYLQKLNKYAAAAIAAAVKWGVMFFSGEYLLQFFLNIDYDELKLITEAFNLPQLIGAVIGGILALAVYRILPDKIKKL